MCHSRKARKAYGVTALSGSREMAMTGAGPQNQQSKKPWDLSNDGMEQLAQLNAMERQQDVTTWNSGAIFAAANGVLLIALFNGIDKIGTPSFLMMCFGNIGLFVCLCWVMTSVRAKTYESIWVVRAKMLEEEYGIPKYCRVWRERPKGVSSWLANLLLMALFMTIWSWLALYGAYSYDVYFLPISGMTFIGIVALSLGIIIANERRRPERESGAKTSVPDQVEYGTPAETEMTNKDILLKLEELEIQNRNGIVLASAFVLMTISLGIMSLSGFKVENEHVAALYVILAFALGGLSLYLVYKFTKLLARRR
jgi:hypothetical protein